MIPTSKLKQLSTKGIKSGALITFCQKPSCSWQSDKTHIKCPECSTSTGLVRYDDEFKTRIGKPKRVRKAAPKKEPAKKPVAKKAPAKKKAGKGK